MGGQSVFNGALGWDDWIWWSAIGGLGLFLLMLVLCCVVCVQRAKRKGREEAMAAVQARERERQTQEQAQLRYAQAQQARYPPAREASYKFSKPEPPASTYNPYGQEDHVMHRNSFHNNAPVPRPKSRRGSQQPSGQQPMQQDAQYQAYQGPPPPKHNGQQQQFYGAAPRRHQPPTMPYEQAPQPYDQPRLEPEELPQVAAYYGRKPKPSAELSPNSGPIMSQQYQRQTQVNPNQPAIAQYRKFSSRSDTPSGPAYVQDDSLTKDETPFVQVSSPRASGASTASASTAYSAVGQPPQVVSDRISLASSSSSAMMRPGATLRSRIDALRDGPAPAPSNENFTRISMGSTTSSLSGSQSSFQAPVQPIPPPTTPSNPVVNRRLAAIASTDLSDASSPGNEYSVARNDNAFEEAVFATARSTQGTVRRRDSDLSIGVDEDPSSPAIQRDQTRRNTRGRTHTGDSTGSIEF